jgi:nucleotide-binding universal stress UspA family protein
VYKQIVVGTDGSAGADAAVDAAVELAGLTGATLHVVAAYKVAGVLAASEVAVMTAGVAEATQASQQIAEEVCEKAAARAERAGVKARAHARPGDPADVLIELAGLVECDLIVVGNRGMSGARRFVLGSVPNKVSHHCSTNLLIVDTSGERG